MKKNKSGLTVAGVIILTLIALVFIALPAIQLFSLPTGTLNFFVRLFALWGYLCLAVAAIMTPFLKEVYKNFGKPFLKMHHGFAFSGLILITLHPVFFAIQARTASVFIPIFTTWYGFWFYAGRPALILLYIAVIAVLFRKKIQPWRIIHILMYLMLLFGFVHALLIGTDFSSRTIIIIYALSFAGAVASFVLKRFQLYKSLKNKH